MRKSSVKRTLQVVISVAVGVLIGVAMPDSGYSQFQPGEKRNVAEGEKLKLKGVVLTRDGETFILRDRTKTDTVVLLTDTRRSGPSGRGSFGDASRLM
jgi:hypothetical protein